MELPANLKKLILIAENQNGEAKVFDLLEEKSNILLTYAMRGMVEYSEREAQMQRA